MPDELSGFEPEPTFNLAALAGQEQLQERIRDLENERATLASFLQAVAVANDWLDGDVSPEYREQPLAHRWARVTKVCSEAGEVMDALSAWSGENPRKGVCGTEGDLLAELGDTASAAILAIQHLTGDTAATWAVVFAAVAKVAQRAAEHTGALPS